MSALVDTRIFNRKEALIEGWYWLMRSDELKRGRARAANLMGRELVVFRGASGHAFAMDAYCPHMGAHLAQGDVQGDEIRCLFHHWKFDAKGRCTDIPCQSQVGFVPQARPWPVEERYGLVWIYAGAKVRHPVPYVPELKGLETDHRLGNRFVKECHPNVVMINAIDAQHFNSVHPMVKRLAGDLFLAPVAVSEHNIEFRNTTPPPRASRVGRLIGRFYAGALTYWMSYWSGSTGSVTVGPDALRFHIIFALRPTADGRTEGQTILVTRRREGWLGRLANRLILVATEIVGNYFAKGDTLIFSKIRFSFRSPIKADHAIIRFVQHVEQQRLAADFLGLGRAEPVLAEAAGETS